MRGRSSRASPRSACTRARFSWPDRLSVAVGRRECGGICAGRRERSPARCFARPRPSSTVSGVPSGAGRMSSATSGPQRRADGARSPRARAGFAGAGRHGHRQGAGALGGAHRNAQRPSWTPAVGSWHRGGRGGTGARGACRRDGAPRRHGRSTPARSCIANSSPRRRPARSRRFDCKAYEVCAQVMVETVVRVAEGETLEPVAQTIAVPDVPVADAERVRASRRGRSRSGWPTTFTAPGRAGMARMSSSPTTAGLPRPSPQPPFGETCHAGRLADQLPEHAREHFRPLLPAAADEHLRVPLRAARSR